MGIATFFDKIISYEMHCVLLRRPWFIRFICFFFFFIFFRFSIKLYIFKNPVCLTRMRFNPKKLVINSVCAVNHHNLFLLDSGGHRLKLNSNTCSDLYRYCPIIRTAATSKTVHRISTENCIQCTVLLKFQLVSWTCFTTYIHFFLSLSSV